jgi:hypothetical protein
MMRSEQYVMHLGTESFRLMTTLVMVVVVMMMIMVTL